MVGSALATPFQCPATGPSIVSTVSMRFPGHGSVVSTSPQSTGGQVIAVPGMVTSIHCGVKAGRDAMPMADASKLGPALLSAPNASGGITGFVATVPQYSPAVQPESIRIPCDHVSAKSSSTTLVGHSTASKHAVNATWHSHTVPTPVAVPSLPVAGPLPASTSTMLGTGFSQILLQSQPFHSVKAFAPIAAPSTQLRGQPVMGKDAVDFPKCYHVLASSQTLPGSQCGVLSNWPSACVVGQSAAGGAAAVAAAREHSARSPELTRHALSVPQRLLAQPGDGRAEDSCLERCLGKSGSQLAFDSGPSDYRRSICLLECPDAVGLTRGTGWLLDFDGRTAVITNHHILDTKECAEATVAVFDYEKQGMMMGLYELDTSLFVTNKQLDYTIVGVREDLDRKPLRIALSEPLVGDKVTVVGHPHGRQRQISTRRIVCINDQCLFYDADTKPGSSGSPVLRWDDGEYIVVGLHRGYDGVSRKNYGSLIQDVLADARNKLSEESAIVLWEPH